jgi:glycosyltransferase involved in cell wall biosynthesis
MGFRSKEEILGEILPSTDIFVNPSLQEWLPTTVIEALLSGCAVVATDVGGTREICNGEDMMIVVPEDAEALVEGLKAMFSKFGHISWMSLEIVKMKFDPKENMRKIYELYVTALEKSPENT